MPTELRARDLTQIEPPETVRRTARFLDDLGSRSWSPEAEALPSDARPRRGGIGQVARLAERFAQRTAGVPALARSVALQTRHDRMLLAALPSTGQPDYGATQADRAPNFVYPRWPGPQLSRYGLFRSPDASEEDTSVYDDFAAPESSALSGGDSAFVERASAAPTVSNVVHPFVTPPLSAVPAMRRARLISRAETKRPTVPRTAAFQKTTLPAPATPQKQPARSIVSVRPLPAVVARMAAFLPFASSDLREEDTFAPKTISSAEPQQTTRPALLESLPARGQVVRKTALPVLARVVSPLGMSRVRQSAANQAARSGVPVPVLSNAADVMQRLPTEVSPAHEAAVPASAGSISRESAGPFQTASPALFGQVPSRFTANLPVLRRMSSEARSVDDKPATSVAAPVLPTPNMIARTDPPPHSEAPALVVRRATIAPTPSAASARPDSATFADALVRRRQAPDPSFSASAATATALDRTATESGRAEALASQLVLRSSAQFGLGGSIRDKVADVPEGQNLSAPRAAAQVQTAPEAIGDARARLSSRSATSEPMLSARIAAQPLRTIQRLAVVAQRGVLSKTTLKKSSAVLPISSRSLESPDVSQKVSDPALVYRKAMTPNALHQEPLQQERLPRGMPGASDLIGGGDLARPMTPGSAPRVDGLSRASMASGSRLIDPPGPAGSTRQPIAGILAFKKSLIATTPITLARRIATGIGAVSSPSLSFVQRARTGTVPFVPAALSLRENAPFDPPSAASPRAPDSQNASPMPPVADFVVARQESAIGGVRSQRPPMTLRSMIPASPSAAAPSAPLESPLLFRSHRSPTTEPRVSPAQTTIGTTNLVLRTAERHPVSERGASAPAMTDDGSIIEKTAVMSAIAQRTQFLQRVVPIPSAPSRILERAATVPENVARFLSQDLIQKPMLVSRTLEEMRPPGAPATVRREDPGAARLVSLSPRAETLDAAPVSNIAESMRPRPAEDRGGFASRGPIRVDLPLRPNQAVQRDGITERIDLGSGLTRETTTLSLIPDGAPKTIRRPSAQGVGGMPLVKRGARSAEPPLTVIQRETTAPPASPSVTQEASAAPESAKEAGDKAAQQVNLVAHEVWALLKRRIADEARRQGRY